jgi:hypothetical protein
MRTRRISKTLSANDTGETGGHQAGILVPKEPGILNFFPSLDPKADNPRCQLMFMDQSGKFWEFSFIYYNNKLRGGTRNEYRLTRMTKYIRECGLNVGDEMSLSRDERDRYLIAYTRLNQPGRTASGALKLGSGWRIVQLYNHGGNK